MGDDTREVAHYSICRPAFRVSLVFCGFWSTNTEHGARSVTCVPYYITRRCVPLNFVFGLRGTRTAHTESLVCVRRGLLGNYLLTSGALKTLEVNFKRKHSKNTTQTHIYTPAPLIPVPLNFWSVPRHFLCCLRAPRYCQCPLTLVSRFSPAKQAARCTDVHCKLGFSRAG